MEQNYIGENIRIYRERANLTQQQLADKVGVSWEMISRYEREESSPYKKLEQLSRALDVTKSQLIEKHIPQRYSSLDYKIPLFLQIPHSYKFTANQTHYYYVCPEWILHRDRKCIAIDSSLINSEYASISNNGITYISMQSELKKNDLVIIKSEKGLSTERYNNESSNVLGKVLAQEVRFNKLQFAK